MLSAQDVPIVVNVPTWAHGAVYTENGVLGTLPYRGRVNAEKVGRIFVVTDSLLFMEIDGAGIPKSGITAAPQRFQLKFHPDSMGSFSLEDPRYARENFDVTAPDETVIKAGREFLEQLGFNTSAKEAIYELFLVSYRSLYQSQYGFATIKDYSTIQCIRWSVVNKRSGREVYSKEICGGHFIGSMKLLGKDAGRLWQEELKYAQKKAFISSIQGLLSDTAFLAATRNRAQEAPSGSAAPWTILEAGSEYASTLQKCLPSVVTLRTKTGFGSAFFVSPSGYLLTNDHVLEQGDSTVTVILNNAFSLEASVVRRSAQTDVALLKVDGIRVIPLRCDSMVRTVGVEVYAIGTPEYTNLSQTLTKGIISGNRDLDGRSYIQTDVAINRGSSGGPLIDQNGNVIGIVTAKLSGDGTESLGFAIPIAEAFKALGIR